MENNYTPLVDRISHANQMYIETRKPYWYLYAKASQNLKLFILLAPSAYDFINNKVFQALKTHKFIVENSPYEEFLEYLTWEQNTIVTPLMSLQFSKNIYFNLINRFCFYLDLKSRVFKFSTSFHKESSRILMAKELYQIYFP